MKKISLGSGLFCTVDDADYELAVSLFIRARAPTPRSPRWRVLCADGSQFARHILGLSRGDGLIGDHIDGDPMNNQRGNLRAVTPSESSYNKTMYASNKSGVKGVSWSKGFDKWEVRVKVDGKQLFGGRYVELEDAEKAARKLREELHGRFANHG